MAGKSMHAGAESSPDVLIVGGGPAGLAAALALRLRGASVTVADAMRPPIDKACGEGLMPDSRRELALLGVNLDSREGGEFRGIRFVNHWQGQTKSGGDLLRDVATAQFPAGGSLGTGIGLGLRRQDLHARLVDAAEQAGVKLRWQSVVQLKENERVLVGGEPATYGYLVGADGQSSRVRRWAGLERGTVLTRRFGFRQHFAVEPWSPYVEVHWAKSGQAYVTPVGPNEVCVATIARDQHCRMHTLLRELPWLREKLSGGSQKELVPVDQERGALTTTRRLQRVVRGPVALLGDASGSADAITGEGMAMAFRQALLLAECLEAGNLERYQELHPAILRLPQTMARVMLMMDRSATFRNRALSMLASEPPLFARMLGVHVGSESLVKFVAAKGLELAWRLAWPAGTVSAAGI